jgi:transcriptional regulator with XRE-family HTH domain
MLKLSFHHTSLGVHLQRERQDRQLTQSDLAQQAQLSIETLRLLEYGKGNLTSFWAVLSTLNLDIVGRNLPLGQHIGERIITLRKRKGVSQRDLVKLVGVSQPTLIALERHTGGRLVQYQKYRRRCANVILSRDQSWQSNVFHLSSRSVRING